MATDENVRQIEIYERHKAAQRHVWRAQAHRSQHEAGNEQSEARRSAHARQIDHIRTLHDNGCTRYCEDGRGDDDPSVTGPRTATEAEGVHGKLLMARTGYAPARGPPMMPTATVPMNKPSTPAASELRPGSGWMGRLDASAAAIGRIV